MVKLKRRKTEAPPVQPVVVLAGAAGFIGSHLAENLVAAGCKVIGLDNLSAGLIQNTASLKGNPGFELIKCDINKGTPESLNRKKITHVVSAVGTVPFLGQEKSELNELLTASLATKSLLDLAVKKKAVFLLLSSTEIYKGVAGSLSLEHYYDHLELSQQLSFLEAKRYAEALAQEYSDLYDLDARVARLPTVYGPRMSLQTGGILARLIRLALDRKDLVVNEEGSKEQYLVFISDLAYGLTKFLLTDQESVKKAILYFVNPEKVSVLSIAYTLKGYLKKEPKVEFLPREHKIEFSRAPKMDIHRTKKELFWEPKVDLSEGLKLTLDYFEKKKTRAQTASQTEGTEKAKVEIGLRKSWVSKPSQRLLKKPSLIEKAVYAASKITQREQLSVTRGWLALKKKSEIKTPKIVKGIELKKQKALWRRLTGPKITGLLLSAFFLVLILPAVVTMVFAGLAAGQLKAREFKGSQNNFLRAQNFWGGEERIWQLLGQENNFKAVDYALTAAFFVARSAQDLYPGLKDLQVAGHNIVERSPALGGKSGKLPQGPLLAKLKKAQLALLAAQQDFLLFNQNLHLSCDSVGAFFYRSLFKCEKALAMADTAEGAVGVVSELLGLGNKVLGFNGAPQTYLVLLQNNMELRATGGFLGSYIALDFNQGKVTRFKVDDIYNPDGILKQKITAPAAAKKYMDVKELGIRDANWWPDFPTSAEKVATLYEFATHEKVAYVLAANLEVIKSLLRATGPIELPTYQETITADNLFERTETQAEVGFKPGSTQKKDFLGELANQLIDRLIKGQNIDGASLGQLLLSNLAQKNILIYARDASLQKSLVQANWAGQVRTAAGDYLMAVDSNVGGNKANFWVSRALSYQVDVDRSGNLIANLQVTWTHAGKSETWPGGKYRNFFRVYVPPGAALVKKQGFFGEVTTGEEFGKTVFGGLVEVPINSKKQIELKYKLPETVGFAHSNQYRLLVQKQGGMEAEQFNFKLNLPPFLTLKQGQTELKQALKQDQLIKFTVKR